MTGSTVRQLLLVILLFAPLAFPRPVDAQHSAGADMEIQYLLAFVAGSDCTFIRNGTAHKAAEAADHLRLKYGRGKRYVDTPEQFIDRLASASSWSGEPYSVECDGQAELAGEWLHQALVDYRNGSAKP